MKKMASYPREENVADATRLSDMFVALEAIEVPTIARVNGAAFGGGAGLVSACDFAIACERAKLSFSEVKLGLLPGVISPYVIDRIGIKNAVQLFTSGERLDPLKALKIGLVDEVVSLEGLDKAVYDLIDLLLTGGPDAIKECKKLARTYGTMNRDEFRNYCIEAIADARASDEGTEGVGAFLEKRKPFWRQNGD
jgi:methylglutaconyl-CoA hydratase